MATGICHTDAYTLDGLDSEHSGESIRSVVVF
jgi:Zn-dependent alcohol dehydrogenase